MPDSCHDSSPTPDIDVSAHCVSVDDAESDYESDGDDIGTVEDYESGELEVLEWSYTDETWGLMEAIDLQDLVLPSMTCTEWMSDKEYKEYLDAVMAINERCLDALPVLAESVGGVAGQWRRNIVAHQENQDAPNVDCIPDLQVLLVLMQSGKAIGTDTDWWEYRALCIPSQGMYHYSFTSNLLEGRIMMDHSRDRPRKDLEEVMRILLPYFREMNARFDTLASNVGYSSDSSWIRAPSDMANLITCLDVAESISKLVPVFGNVLEGMCKILRRTFEAAEKAHAAREECRALAEHTALITLAILHEIGLATTLSSVDLNRIWDLRDTIKIVDSRIKGLSKLGSTWYVFNRGRVNAEVMHLRARVENERIAFNIRNYIRTARLLTDLVKMQTRFAACGHND